MDWAYTVAGLAVGFVVGLTGVGGGSLMTPLLVLGFGLSPLVAVGTDLLYAAVTKAGGTLVHARQRTVDWRIAGLLAAGSLPAALVTVSLLGNLTDDPQRLSSLITGTLGVALMLTAAVLLLRNPIRRLAEGTAGSLLNKLKRGRDLATVLVGALLGVLVSISSVGAGALGAAALMLLYPWLPAARVVGTDIVHAVPLTLSAGLGHAALGTVDYALLGALLLGSLPGIALGSLAARRVPEGALRPALAAMLALVGARLVI